MAWFLTQLDGRDAAKLKLTEKEAWAMWKEGFKFSIFDPEQDEYRLSVPYRIAENRGKGTLAISQ